MEMNELKYFLEVAKIESVNKAGESLNISAGSLSKAISRLEEELGVQLFKRVGRNIKLTDYGRLLKVRASDILNLETSTRLEIGGAEQQINAVVCGEELLLTEYGVPLVKKLKDRFPNSIFKFEACATNEAINKVNYGESHFALVTKTHSALQSKIIDKVKFKTCVGKKHPFYKKLSVDIEEALKHSFVIPTYGFLGKVKSEQSFDGWRDDKFPRKLDFQVSHASTLYQIVESGVAIAYLPEYIVNNLDVKILNIKGCPYTCEQNIYVTLKKDHQVSWLNHIF